MTAVLVAVIALLFTSPAFAKSDVAEQLAEEQARQAALARKAESLNAEVSGLKSKLVRTSASIRETEENISETADKLGDLREKKSGYLEQLGRNRTAFGGLIGGARKFSRASTPDILLQSTPIDAARAALVMKTMIPTIGAQSEALRAQLEKLAAVEDDIVTQQAVLKKELKEINEQQDDLSKLIEKRQGVYKKTESSRAAQEAAVRKLAREARNLEDLVSKIEPVAAAKPSGYRPPPGTLMPVHGVVMTAFGERDELGAKSKGLTFSTRGKATVITPLAGKVKFAGPFQKFRQILIIEHAGGYHSLIAGLGRIDTVVGAALAAGEPVATTENEPDARVYYELRQNGTPVNPGKLLAERRRQNRS